jgi:hypothetical protein
LGEFLLFAAQVGPFVLGFLFSSCLSFSDRRAEKDWRIVVVQNFLGVQKTRGASFSVHTFAVLFSSSCKSKPYPHSNCSTCSSIVNIEIEEQSLLRRRPLSSFAIERFLLFRLCSFSQVKAVRCGNCRTCGISVNKGTMELIPRQ